MFRSLVQRFWLVSLFVLAGTGSLLAQKTEPHQEPAKEIKLPPNNLKFKFIDKDGHPIEGIAIKRQSGIIYADMPLVSIGGDVRDLNGEDPVSGSDGSVECVVPNTQSGDVIRIWIETNHDDFVPWREYIDVVEGVNEVVLERGIQVAVTAIDSGTNKPITENLFGITGRIENWKPMKNGRLVSPALAKDCRRFQLAQIVDGVPTHFSEPVEIKQQDGGKLMLNDIPMFPAQKLKGTLSPKVPRPIKNGQVHILSHGLNPKTNNSRIA